MDVDFWRKFSFAVDKLFSKAWWLSFTGVFMIIGASFFLFVSVYQAYAAYKMHSMPTGNNHSSEYLKEQFNIIIEDFKQDQ
jgi:hypothetical protein